MSEKFTRKELRAPDAFQRIGASVREWLQNRWGPLVVGVVLIFTVGGVAAFAKHISNRREAKAAQALGAALGAPNPSVADEESEEPPSSSGKAKDEKLIKELTEVRKEYPKGRTAVTAEFGIAEAELRLGQYDQAIASFEDYLNKAPATEPLRASALEGEGYAYEAKGNLDRAIAAFDRMAKENKTDFLTGMGQYHRARILVLQNRKEEAAAVFSEVKSTYPGSAAARSASERLVRLAGEGIKPPPPKSSTDAG